MTSGGRNRRLYSASRKRRQDTTVAAVDLFCGVGGLTHGLKKGGVNVVAGVDVDPACRYPYEINNDARFIEKSVTDLHAHDLESYFGCAKFRLLAGCAPCQPFSSYSRRHGRNRGDDKWPLLEEFGRSVAETQPDFVTMENVPQLADHHVFQIFLAQLESYYTSWQIVECSQLGVPQTRSRLVLLASKHGELTLSPPSPTGRTPPTVRAAIGHLPAILAGGTDSADALHVASRLSPINLRRIHASVPGGTWRDWDASLRAECHRKSSGETYPSVYGRMEWDRPAPTMTTQCFGFGNGRFGHPEQDRAISLREAALLQTFPGTYKFVQPGERIRFNRLGRLIGNAVPVQLGRAIGSSITHHAQLLQSRSE
jgi:DNA (cytosine-5)-methyltransferase 1